MKKNKKNDGIVISFVDSYSAIDVTGSNIFVETPNYKILLDCGLHQSNNKLDDYLVNSRKPKEYKPKELDFIFVLHTHGDHCLLVPKYYKDGFRGATVMPSNTKDVYKKMAMDSAYINERDVKVINDQNKTKYLPLYTIEDVDTSVNHILEYPINEKIKINEELEFMFIPSGHLLNGCQLLLWITVGETKKCIGYTSDIGNPLVDNKFVGKLERIESCDLMIAESTYGDRKDLKVRTKERNNDLDKLKTIIDTQILQLKGRVVIPTFAQCRSVQLLEFLYRTYGEDFPYKIYLDSPLAIGLFRDLENQLDDEDLEIFNKILNWKALILSKESIESKAIVESKEPCLVISTSGMMNVGRIRHHFKRIVSDPNATILFCGYSTDGSLASMLKDNKRKTIDIDGKEYKIRCASYNLKSMSGHATHEILLDYYSNVNCNKIILHHGSEKAKNELAKDLKEELSRKCKSTRVICANNSLKVNL